LDGTATKNRVISLRKRMREIRHLLRNSFAEIRILRYRNARLFQQRLDQLQHEIAIQTTQRGLSSSLDYLEEFERRAIELALEHSDGDAWQAAMLLGMLPEELQKKRERYGLLVSEKEEG